MANASPTQARSRLTDEPAQPMRAEAIAMRRIVVEMGYWLSPLLRDHPLPVLSEWERTVDLSKLDRSTTAAQKGRQREEQAKSTLAKIDRGGAGPQRVFEPRTVTDIHLQRVKTPATKATLQARKAHRTEVVELAKAQGKSPAEVDRELALARIAAVAAEKAAAEQKANDEARAARRREVARAANDRYKAKLQANPELAEARREAKRAQQRKGAPRPIPNPHRDPTLPTARELREEAIRAEAIEAEERRLLALMRKEGRRVTSERNLHPAPSKGAGTQRGDR